MICEPATRRSRSPESPPTGASRRGGQTCAQLGLALVVLAGALLAHAPAAEAKHAVAFLRFGGGKAGRNARRALMRAIRRRYRAVSGQRVLDAADDLGIRFRKGRNLARAAKKAGVIAVVGGKVARRRLAIAVFSGSDGSVLVSTSVRWVWASGKAVRRARRVLYRALREAAANAPDSGGGGGKSGGGSLSFKPQNITRKGGSGSGGGGGKSGGGGGKSGGGGGGDTDGGLSFKPEPVGRGGSGGSGGSGAGGSGSGSGGSGAGGSGSGSGDGGDGDGDGGTVRKGAKGSTRQRFAPEVGFGIWARVFRFNDAAPTQNHGEYTSGAVFALAFGLRAHPASFVTKGFLADLYTRLRFKIALGLSSKVTETGNESLSTSLWEVMFDLGYRWQFKDTDSSPALDLGIGFGSMSFAIDWAGAQPALTNVSYTFMQIGAGFSWPIVKSLGDAKTAAGALGGLDVLLGFGYRIVFSAGDIEDADQWYGPASTGGIDLRLGARWRFGSISAGLVYNLTYYFFAFTETSQARATSGKLTAGGATDTSHTTLLTASYSF